ncbi:MAG: hypothetical protein HFJ60_01920 [Clostridia bacterium]|jgi:hypothetical protein|nr:hypothetical protein [Clostridia bacterium]
MFNVMVEPKVLKLLKNEGYTCEVENNKIIMRTREGAFSFGIIYKEDTYELLVFSQKEFRYATYVTIEFDKTRKCPALMTQMKRKETTVFKTVECYSD